MKLLALYESIELNPRQLDSIIRDIAIDLKSKLRSFPISVQRQMTRYGYHGKAVASQIGREMRRRSALRRKRSEATSGSIAHNRALPPRGSEYQRRLVAAIDYAKASYLESLIDSPELDEVDMFDFVDAAAEKFNVRAQDVAGKMRSRL